MLSKFLVSIRLDGVRAARCSRVTPSEPSVRAADFERRCVELERRLRAGVPPTTMPAELHARIMHEVRALERTRRLSFRLPWSAAASSLFLVALLLGGPWYSRTQRAPVAAAPGSLGGLSVAFETASRLPMESPRAFVSPLANELESLNADLRGAAGVLLASLPSTGPALSAQP